MISIEHHEGVNYCGAVTLIFEAYAELTATGLHPDELAVGWDHNVVLAVDVEPIGLMIWSEEKHTRGAWLTLSYVRPQHRRRGVFKTMWAALVEKVAEKKLIQIRSLTSMHNAPLRAAAAAVGRIEEMVQTVYRMGPRLPLEPAEPETDESYRARLLLLIGPGSTNHEKAATATGAVLDEIGSYYVGGARR